MAMKLLLREDVSGLGKMGDIVTVADGYGRNYLLPRKLAVVPSKGNLQAIETEKKRRAEKEQARMVTMRSLAGRISATDITLKERVAGDDKLYGSVTDRDIAAALSEEGIQVEPEMIQMEEPIKTLGVHRVIVRLHPEVGAELKVWVVALKDSESRITE